MWNGPNDRTLYHNRVALYEDEKKAWSSLRKLDMKFNMFLSCNETADGDTLLREFDQVVHLMDFSREYVMWYDNLQREVLTSHTHARTRTRTHIHKNTRAQSAVMRTIEAPSKDQYLHHFNSTDVVIRHALTRFLTCLHTRNTCDTWFMFP